MFFKIGVLKNLAYLTTKHLCWSLFFNKVAGLQEINFIKKRYQHKCFPVEIGKFLRTPFFTKHLRWLLTCKSSDLIFFLFPYRATHNLFMLVNKHVKQTVPVESTTEQLHKVSSFCRLSRDLILSQKLIKCQQASLWLINTRTKSWYELFKPNFLISALTRK